MNESPRSWVLPEEPVPVRLMGTIWADTDGLHDDLDTPFGLAAWMDAVGIQHSDTLASPEELAEARALRDSLRCLAAHQTDDTRPAAVSRADVAWSLDVLNAAGDHGRNLWATRGPLVSPEPGAGHSHGPDK